MKNFVLYKSGNIPGIISFKKRFVCFITCQLSRLAGFSIFSSRDEFDVDGIIQFGTALKIIEKFSIHGFVQPFS